uniref:Uncharacterized protein n=1 Tax=Pediococcus pentosaceus TaxID=1255 RepID=A0A1B4Z3L4_PEDPE|nr:hypothetical protein [Pediococcus pentosaceus]BAV54014.1 hypothetical protein [Pediococcus pentosaceus]
MSIPVEAVIRNVGEVFNQKPLLKKLIAASGNTYDALVVETLAGVIVASPINATNEKGEAWRYPVSANGMLFNLKVSGALRELKPMSRVIMRDVTMGLMPNGRGVWVKAESIEEMENK